MLVGFYGQEYENINEILHTIRKEEDIRSAVNFISIIIFYC